MKKVSIIVHSHYLSNLIRRLHEAGFVEITETLKRDQNYSKLLKPGKSKDVTVKCVSYGLRNNRIIDVLERVAPPPEGLFRSFTRPEPRPRTTVKIKDTETLLAETESIFNRIEDKVLDLDSQFNALDEELNTLEHQKEQIRMLRPIRFDLGYLGYSQHLMIKAGMVDSVEQLKMALKDMKNISYRYAEVDEKYSVVIAAHITQQSELESKLRGRFFTEFDISGFQGTPEQVLSTLDNKIDALNKKKESKLESLKKFYDAWYKRLLVMDEELENERQRNDVFNKFGETQNTKIITGWVQVKEQERLLRICDEVSSGHAICHFSDHPADEEEDVPVKLQNPGWIRPFEVLTTLFATPKYNEIDPTLIISIPFVFFFGLMLGDAGYGLVILILCLFGYFSVGKIRPVVKQASYIGIFMAISTIFFGILMGSFFGDLVPRLIYGDPAAPLYNAVLLGFPLPYNPIRMPILLLQTSLILGLSYLILSVIVAAGHNLKYGNYKEFALGQLSWFILIPFGLILIFTGFFKFEFTPMIMNLSYIMVIIGIVLLFIDKKMLFFFDLTGYLGDTLSFTRLLALGLATAGVAMTINIIGELMLPAHPAMIALVIILLFFGHLVNFMLQALGAGIHSLRLQYVEFFSRCYVGGGNSFQPFKARHIITKPRSRKN